MGEHTRDKILDIINCAVEDSNKAETLTKYRDPIIGFASANDELFNNLSDTIGYSVLHPKELLPEAGTVVAFFIPFNEMVIKYARKRASFTNQEWGLAYYELNLLISKIMTAIVEEMTKIGIKAVKEPVTENYDPVELTVKWPHKSAAYIAGLGTFGINRLIITPLGCAGRLGTVIISEEITPTQRPVKENCAYLDNGTCGVCVKSCPTQALRYNSFSRFVCNTHTQMREEPSYFDRGCCRCSTGYCSTFREPLKNHDVWIGRKKSDSFKDCNR